MTAKPEHEESLWWLAASPALWLAHFLASYLTAALWCAKSGGSLAGVRIAIALYTALALAGVTFVGRHALRRHRFGGSSVPHDLDTPEDRHRFLGWITLLLTLLGAVAIVYVTLPILLFTTCR
jgi:hypothetical protein